MKEGQKMKRDAVILVIATILLTVLAYQGRPMEKAGIAEVYTVAEMVTELEETETVAESQIAETEIATEMEVVEAAVTEAVQTGFVMYSPIWDKVYMTFYPDGSCVFELPEYEVAEPCTWTYQDGILNVVRQDGEIFTSYIAEDRATLRLDYEALIHKDLIGQFSSVDYKEFFEEENVEATES